MEDTKPTESQEIEKEVEEPVKETEKPESDPILSSLNDDQSENKSDVKPEESEEDKKEKTDKPAEKEPTIDDDKKESETEAKPEVEQPEDEKEKTEDKESKEEDKELDPEEAKKEEARRRYEEREKVRAERQARVTEQTQQYVDEAADDTDQRLRAMEVKNYNQTIEHTENTLISEFDRVKANPELQIFNPDNKEQFSPNLYAKAMKDYNAGYIHYDENGNMVGLKGSLYQHLTETAELYRGAIKSGAFQQVRDQRKMKTKADSKPAETPKEEVKDPILEVLQSE